jgi:hypothetical protein
MKTNPQFTNGQSETHTPRIIALSLLALLAILALTGCQNQPATTADASTAGKYSLLSVDGKTVPCHLNHEGVAMTVESGVFTIDTNGTCRSLITFSAAGHQNIEREVKATFSQNGSELTMRWEGAGTTKGQIRSNEFTMNNEGMIFQYRK